MKPSLWIHRLGSVGPILLTTLCMGAGDPKGQDNRAPTSLLPQGPGLAAAYSADDGIAAHTSVHFAENFEVPHYASRWDEIRNPKDEVLSLMDPSTESSLLGKNALKVTAVLGRNTGGGMTQWFESSETVFVRFYVKFDEACDYVHHFCTLRANKGLKGGDRWSGFGGAGLKPEGSERFSTALEPWGNWGRYPAPGRWNFYSYWHQMSPSPDGKYWGNSFAAKEQPDIVRGRWICAEFMLKHNSPGMADGEQAYWIDGALRGHWTGIAWRQDAKLMANAITIESYVTDRWTKHPTNIVYFDNVVIASEYVGPAGAGEGGPKP
jgi:hypothetical protein